MAECWGDVFEAYSLGDPAFPGQGTILRRVPFPFSTISAVAFAEVGASSGNAKRLGELLAENRQAGTRLDLTMQCELFSGIVLTPDCDVAQGNANTLTVALVLSVEEYIGKFELKADKAKKLREKVEEAEKNNPGQFAKPGVFLLPRSEEHRFDTSLVIMFNTTGLPVEWEPGSERLVRPETYGGPDNLLLRIADQGLKARLGSEYARLMSRVGLENLPKPKSETPQTF